ncbi:pro-sigmaK processing inhibitor BofA family protein [Jeotgalibacillus sp. R-1-5s-1]|uniref:pro-sigmaK processing inhibitor BofA family protein n=1 Tax=Jeotgalibacillus sp. R-1-5s-1 TaxID=2555897 RepID=UPI001FC8125C|nr:pro-sigmaK processing inhibitor BofA family protein [Jeotgalibacillus sp. R-1-5s-1]
MIWLWGAGTLITVLMIFTVGIVPFLKWMWRMGTKWIVGLGLLFIVNRFGQEYGLYVPMNPVTTGIAGILGIPGTAALVFIFRV